VELAEPGTRNRTDKKGASLSAKQVHAQQADAKSNLYLLMLKARRPEEGKPWGEGAKLKCYWSRENWIIGSHNRARASLPSPVPNTCNCAMQACPHVARIHGGLGRRRRRLLLFAATAEAGSLRQGIRTPAGCQPTQ